MVGINCVQIAFYAFYDYNRRLQCIMILVQWDCIEYLFYIIYINQAAVIETHTAAKCWSRQCFHDDVCQHSLHRIGSEFNVVVLCTYFKILQGEVTVPKQIKKKRITNPYCYSAILTSKRLKILGISMRFPRYEKGMPIVFARSRATYKTSEFFLDLLKHRCRHEILATWIAILAKYWKTLRSTLGNYALLWWRRSAARW